MPPNDPIIQRYKELRLLGLQTDPASFVSTYEREAAYLPEKWRVSRKPWPEQEKATIVATSSELDVSNVDGEIGGQTEGDVSDFRRAGTERWVGMVVALAPNHEGVKENPIFAPLASKHEMKGRYDKIYVTSCYSGSSRISRKGDREGINGEECGMDRTEVQGSRGRGRRSTYSA